MFLIDTNCWMQLARYRDQADEVRRLLSAVPTELLHISIFSVHSLGVILSRKGMLVGYSAFLQACSIGTEIRIVHLTLEDLVQVEQLSERWKLDFDDAFQYVVAERHHLKLVSLDADFDRIPNGRLTPAQALELFRNEQAT